MRARRQRIGLKAEVGGITCKGKCGKDGPLAKKYRIGALRGNSKHKNQGLTPTKCGVCEIKLYGFEGNKCPCCNVLLRTSTKYKPKSQIHKLDDDKTKLKLTQKIVLDDGSKVEIIKVVVLPEPTETVVMSKPVIILGDLLAEPEKIE